MKAVSIIIICFLFLSRFGAHEMNKFQMSGVAQGTTYHITYYSEKELVTSENVDSILNSLDSSLSIYKAYSVINKFNASDNGFIIDKHLNIVVTKALDTYRQTNGLFDITILPLVQAWGFGNKANADMPDSAQVKSLLNCVGSENLILEGNFLGKRKKCLQIDVNGIAQGYSVDVLADYFEHAGVNNYMIELGGEIRVKGKKFPENVAMRIGIEAPVNDWQEDYLQRTISMDSGAVTTSGSYRKYYESGGRKISHIIDPRTGYAVESDLISVTVFANDAITADAYDNALMLMGLEKAMRFINKRDDIKAYFIYKKTNGEIADTVSNNLRGCLGSL